MIIADSHEFLPESTVEKVRETLLKNGFDPERFSLKVSEDQSSMDMNDLDYKVMLRINLKSQDGLFELEYLTEAERQAWIDTLEDDLSRS